MYIPAPQLFYRIDHTAANVAQWRVFDFVYCNQGPYPTAQALLVRVPSLLLQWLQSALLATPMTVERVCGMSCRAVPRLGPPSLYLRPLSPHPAQNAFNANQIKRCAAPYGAQPNNQLTVCGQA